MYATLLFIGSLFTVSLGNAMRKVTNHRRAKAEAGEPTAGTSKAYDVTGLILCWGGGLALIFWVLWIGVGNPIDFITGQISD